MPYLSRIQKLETPGERRELIRTLWDDQAFTRDVMLTPDLMGAVISARAVIPLSLTERLETSPEVFTRFAALSVSCEFSPPETMTWPLLRLASQTPEAVAAVRSLFTSSKRDFLFEHVVFLINSNLSDLASDIAASNKAYLTPATVKVLMDAGSSNELVIQSFLEVVSLAPKSDVVGRVAAYLTGGVPRPAKYYQHYSRGRYEDGRYGDERDGEDPYAFLDRPIGELTADEALSLLLIPGQNVFDHKLTSTLLKTAVGAFGWGAVTPMGPEKIAKTIGLDFQAEMAWSVNSYKVKPWHPMFEHPAFDEIKMEIIQDLSPRQGSLSFFPVIEPSAPRGVYLHALSPQALRGMPMETLLLIDFRAIPEHLFAGFFRVLVRRLKTADEVASAAPVFLLAASKNTPTELVRVIESGHFSHELKHALSAVLSSLPSSFHSAFTKAGILVSKTGPSKKKKFFTEALYALNSNDPKAFRSFVTETYPMKTFCEDTHLSSHASTMNNKGRIPLDTLAWLTRDEVVQIIDRSQISFVKRYSFDDDHLTFSWRLETPADYDLASKLDDDIVLLDWARDPVAAARYLAAHEKYASFQSLMTALIALEPSIIQSGVYLELLMRVRAGEDGQPSHVKIEIEELLRLLSHYTRAEMSAATKIFDSPEYLRYLSSFDLSIINARFSDGEYVIKEEELLALVGRHFPGKLSSHPIDVIHALDLRASPLSMILAIAGARKNAKAYKALLPTISCRLGETVEFYKRYIEAKTQTTEQRTSQLAKHLEAGMDYHDLRNKYSATILELVAASEGRPIDLTSTVGDNRSDNVHELTEFLLAGGRAVIKDFQMDERGPVAAQLVAVNEAHPNRLSILNLDIRYLVEITPGSKKLIEAFPLATIHGVETLKLAHEINRAFGMARVAEENRESLVALVMEAIRDGRFLDGLPFTIDIVEFAENELGISRDEPWATFLIYNSLKHGDPKVLAHVIHFASDMLPAMFLDEDRITKFNSLKAHKFKAVLMEHGASFISSDRLEEKQLKERVIAEGVHFGNVPARDWTDDAKIRFFKFLERRVDQRFRSLNMETVVLRDVHVISNFEVMSSQFSPLDDQSLAELFALDQKNSTNKFVLDQLRVIARSDRAMLPYIASVKVLLKALSPKVVSQGELTKIKFTDSKTVTVTQTISANVEGIAAVAGYLEQAADMTGVRILKNLKRDDLQAFFDKFTSASDFQDTVRSVDDIARLLSRRREFIASVVDGSVDRAWLEGEYRVLSETSEKNDRWSSAMSEVATVLKSRSAAASDSQRSPDLDDPSDLHALVTDPETSKILSAVVLSNLNQEMATFDDTFARHLDILEPRILHDSIMQLQRDVSALFKNKNMPLGQSHMRPLEKKERTKDLGVSLYFPKTKADLSHMQNLYGWCVGTSQHYGENISKKGNILVCLCPGDEEPSINNALALAHFESQGRGQYRLEQLKGPKNRDMTDHFPHAQILRLISAFITKRAERDAA